MRNFFLSYFRQKVGLVIQVAQLLSSKCFFFCHPVFSFLSFQCSPLSSQCVTLGSRCKNICKSCNWQGILETYVENNFYDEISWIPVSRTGMTKVNTGMTPCLTERSYSSVADTGITPFLYFCLQR
ncbi:hypothetical protein [Wolbachia endosymbiont of Aedes albopictus]|uniref:hypothetical protein n=1 Tax=Wolbachia endosymbiont of Aedes albopictus TaxID=167957 RepID=UPI00216AA536|nr:hypothetical protein [Wolbachia endosymbiont of Aedes albopictus]